MIFPSRRRARLTALLVAGLLAGSVLSAGPGAATAAAQVTPEPVPEQPVPVAPAPDQVTPALAPPDVIVQGGGWGHSVGMSQYGAYAQARAGRSHADILRHYYPGVAVGGHPGVPGELRVGLLQAQSAIVVRTSSRDGGQPSKLASVAFGPEAMELPWCGGCPPVDYTITFEGGRYVLRDEAGTVRLVGDGPVRVHYDFLDGNPTLLRLPQLMAAGDRGVSEAALAAAGNRAGTYQWGRLEVSEMSGGQLRAVMVLQTQLYLRGLAEMPSSWHPEALRAQAIAGRTYATRRAGALDPACQCHLGATPLHQVYAGWAKEGDPTFGRGWVAAVEGTNGVVVSSGGAPAQTYYSSSHGGRTENSQDSWAFSTPFPYLVSVDDHWSLDPAVRNPFGSWAAPFSNRRFADIVAPDVATITGVRPVGDRTAGGTPRELEVTGWDAAGERVTRRYTGGGKNIAGANLKLALRAELRSQQIATLGFPPFGDDEGSVHEYNIWAIDARQITGGCDASDPGRFCPLASV
ncbi:MAG: SpoIID/LytB domain-containing protein, partial [Acidimicrobiales bacterium]